jgi:hypothetical protein
MKNDEFEKNKNEREKKLKEIDKKIKLAEKIINHDVTQFAQFTVRIELKGVITKSDYEKLDLEMNKEKFTNTIILDGMFKLPTTEYSIEGKYLTREVLDLAVHAATKTGKKFSILVTKSAEREFINLERLGK